MNRNEEMIKKILKGLKLTTITDKDLKFVKVKILNKQSVIDKGYEELIGKEFYLRFACENKVCIDDGNMGVWFGANEYEFVTE